MSLPPPASLRTIANQIRVATDTPEAVAEAVSRVRLLTNSLPALIAFFSMDELRCLFANGAYAKSYGFDEKSIVGKPVREIIGEEAFALILPYIARASTGEIVTYQRNVKFPGGAERMIEVTLTPYVDDEGKATSAFVLINDISRFHEAEKAVRESEERVRKFADATSEGIVFFENGIVTDANNALAEMMRGKVEDLVGKRVLEFVDEPFKLTVAQHIRDGYERPYEGRVKRFDGTLFAADFVGKTIVYQGKTLRMTVVRDITDRKEAEARIQFLAHHDALTHLPNRVLFNDQLQLALASARRRGNMVAVFFIDLDNFKTINDSLGHHIGDDLLKRVAKRLQSCIRDSDLIARLGGDEFVIAITDIDSVDEAAPVAEKLAQALGEPLPLEGQLLTVAASIGISVFPKDGDSVEALIRNADNAMYLAKDRGRSNFQFFTPSLHEAANHALAMESGIRNAIKFAEFVLHYQPEVLSKTGMLTSVEALIRWQHPEMGLLSPAKFIPLAEHRGLIVPIGRWVLNDAIRQAREWLDAGIRVPVAVNLSAMQFKQKGLVEDIAARLAEHQLPGELLELELTESLFLEDASAAGKTLGRLKDLGVTLAIDDFGTGYSSLAYLKRYPIDKVKIDRSFIRDIPNDKDDVAITLAIINLAESMGLRVVAEGVETPEQVEFLEHHHCDYIQGFLISHPLPAQELWQWLKRRM
jgi:diguanylate cyclase (GGDEF)-like protein/PAS domain S-box-containing protein